MKEVKYILQGLDCANCAMKIEKQLNKMSGIESAVVDFATLRCTIKYENYSEEFEDKVIKRIMEIEEDVTVKKSGGHHHETCDCGHEHEHHHETCGCGHEHEHHHETCGCEHEHEHHHESCSCGHDHEPSSRSHNGKNKWSISGLDCANCALKIEDKLNSLDGVKHASLNFTTGTLLFDLDDHFDDKQVKMLMKNTIHEMESDVVIEEAQTKPVKKASLAVKEQLIPIVIGAVLLVIGIMVKANNTLSIALYLLAYVIVGWKVLKKAFKNICRGEIFDENFLMGIATLGALIIGEYTEAIAVLIFYEVGEMFQSFSVGKSRDSIANLMNIKSDVAHLIQEGKEVDVHPDTVQVNEIILVKPGERVALDGVIVNGSGSIDTSALTGESMPSEVEVGSEVMAGCVNLNSVLQVKVSKPYSQSTVSRILELVENASSKKAITEQKITSFARVYTPIVCALALAIAIIPQFFNTGYEWSEWVRRACTFLVISCPCALVLSVPLGYFAGIGAASKKGVLIKGGNYLEVLKDLDTIVFDKTGTLTTGTFSVTEIQGDDVDQLLAYAALAESYSTHPIAQSIVKRYGKAIDKTAISEVEEIAGHGVHVVVNGENIYAGNRKLMDQFMIDAPSVDADGTLVYVAKENQYLGYLVIADTIKPTTKNALSELKNLGIHKTVMLTGDREKTALRVAEQVGIDEVHAQLLPTDKVDEIEKILSDEKNQKVAFVGDGINDAPVLARCDLGIAMGGIGSEAAIEAADIVLMKDNLDAIGDAIRVAKKTQRIMNQNITFVLAVKFLILVLGALGYANMWLGVFADVGVAIIAILNAMRILK